MSTEIGRILETFQVLPESLSQSFYPSGGSQDGVGLGLVSEKQTDLDMQTPGMLKEYRAVSEAHGNKAQEETSGQFGCLRDYVRGAGEMIPQLRVQI